MLFTVVPLLERGRPRTPQEVAATRPQPGELRVEDRHDKVRKRTLRLARLLASDDLDEDLMPPLEGAELIGMSPVGFTLSGVEYRDGTYVAQTWLVRQAPPRPPPNLDKMHPAQRRKLDQ